MTTFDFKVSVIVPVYQAEKYLDRALQSLISLVEVGEIILIEDGSSDRSLRLCEEWELRDPKIRLFKHLNNENKGAGPSRNLGIEKATCDFISFLDADDYYLPNRFEKSKELFVDGTIDGVYEVNGSMAVNEKGLRMVTKKKSAKTAVNEVSFKPLPKVPSKKIFQNFLYHQMPYWHTNSITLRRSSLDKFNLRFENLRLHQDTLLWIKCAYYLKLIPGNVDQPVAIRTYHGANRISKRNFESGSVLEKHLFEWARNESISLRQKQKIVKRYSYYYPGRKHKDSNNLLKYSELIRIRASLFARMLRKSKFKNPHGMILGTNQENYIDPIYSAITSRCQDLSFDMLLPFEANSAPGEKPYRQIQRETLRKSIGPIFLQFFRKYFWLYSFFQLLEANTPRQFIGSVRYWFRLASRKAVYHDHDTFHFHFINWKNSLDVFFIPEDKEIILSFWGSDLMRNFGVVNLLVVQYALERASVITLQSQEMREILLSKFGRYLNSKTKVMKFILTKKIFTEIDNVGEIAASEYLISVGHNANPFNNHLEIVKCLKKLPDSIKEKIKLVFVFGYGIGEKDNWIEYKSQLVEMLDRYQFKYLFYNDYLNEKEIARLRKESGIFVHLPASDALSAAITECFYAGNLVITGSWLPYGPFRQAGLKYEQIIDFKDLPRTLERAVTNFQLLKTDLQKNHDKVTSHFLSEDVDRNWIALYSKYCQ